MAVSEDLIPNPSASNGAQSGSTDSKFSLSSLVGPTLLHRNGTPIDSNIVVTDVIGIYFSAHWCPPCRAFTPQLVALYQNSRTFNKSFEVIFVSSDHSVSQFNDYFESMGDWLAIPHGSHYKNALGMRFAVQGIPTLILLNGITGNVITQRGRERVADPSFLSTLPPDIDPEVRNFQSIEAVLNSLDTPDYTSNQPPPTEDQKRVGFILIASALQNILSYPNEPKYRVMKKSNKNVEIKVGTSEK